MNHHHQTHLKEHSQIIIIILITSVTFIDDVSVSMGVTFTFIDDVSVSIGVVFIMLVMLSKCLKFQVVNCNSC